MKSEASDPHKIEPWFQNPFDPSRRIFWVICPSHQVIKMIQDTISYNLFAVKEHDKCFVLVLGWSDKAW